MFARLTLAGAAATLLAAAGSDAGHLSTGVSLLATVGAGSATTITVALISAFGRRHDQRELEAELVDLRRDLREAEGRADRAEMRERAARAELGRVRDEMRRHP